MTHDIQKANLGKRIAAWFFDLFFVAALAVGCGFALSSILGYDGYNQTLESAYSKYETQYDTVFDITRAEYEAMTAVQKESYDAAYNALLADEGAMSAYRMLVNLSLVIVACSILLAMLIWELFIPLFLGNGRTLGKKVFGLCLVRKDGGLLNNLQLFARTLLGKFVIESLIPVYILLMLFWGSASPVGAAILLGLPILQFLLLRFSSTGCVIHDLVSGAIVADKAALTLLNLTED